MIILSYFLLLTLFRTLTLALPSITTNTASLADPSINCGFAFSFMPNPYCSYFLRYWSTNPIITGTYAFGRLEPYPGKTPLILSGVNCQLKLQVKPHVQMQDWESETMRLANYWERLWQVQGRCLRQGTGFNWGRVDVGVTGAYEIILSGSPKGPGNTG